MGGLTLASSDAILELLGWRTFPFALEIGAGAGDLSVRLAPRCGRLITLEPSRVLAARARGRLRSFDNVDVRVGVELPSWTFDLVVARAGDVPLAVMPRGATLLAPADLEHPELVRVVRAGDLARFERR